MNGYTRRYLHTRGGIAYEIILVRFLRRSFLYHTIIISQNRIEEIWKPAAGCEAGARGSTNNVFILYGCRSALESVSF